MMNILTTVDVAITRGNVAYPVCIQPGLLTQLHRLMETNLPQVKKIILVTDETVDGLYGDSVITSLEASDFEVCRFVVPPGEESKTVAMAGKFYTEALLMNLSRSDAVIALGGGVVGDLAGFCAATFYRGVNFVQIPTTLLAQVDSSVGGKVAVNFAHAKNGVGTFYQPAFVLIDPDVLRTLPERQRKAGLAEVLKYALIEENCTGDIGLFDFLKSNVERLSDPTGSHWVALIAQCCRIKKAVVVQDETDSAGIRLYLNLGHTFAHAYEAATHYVTLLHGEAVAIGLMKACTLAHAMKLFPKAELAAVWELFEKLGLSAEPPGGLDPKILLDLMKLDKKAEGGKIKIILPTAHVGQVTVRDNLPEELILSFL